mgnify:FL=1
MKTIKLQQVEHNTKIGKDCPYYEPNVKDDCLLEVDGQIIGFYIKDVKKYSKRLNLLLAVADKEFRSDNVPKSTMTRSQALMTSYKKTGDYKSEDSVQQYSTILGSVAPRPHMRRPYPNISSVHRDKKAQTFIKAMWGCLPVVYLILI